MHSFLLQFITDYSALQQWLPVVFLAMLASALLVGLYYIIGVAINSGRVKDTARYEFGQVIGTAIVVVLIIIALVVFSSLFSTVVPRSSMQNICNTLKGGQLDIINSAYSSGGSPSPTEVICNNLINGNGGGADITDNLDYGLGSTYVIVANVTNQTASNTNALYIFSTWISFLTTFRGGNEVCFPVDCFSSDLPAVSVAYSFGPLTGYDFITKGVLLPLQTQAIFLFQMNVMQLIIVILMLYMWPYLLAAGMILRATIIGRRIGGLLIAIAVTAVIVYPLVFLSEYVSLTSNNLYPIGVPANAIPATFSNSAPTSFLGTGTTSNSFSNLNIYELPTNDFPFNSFDNQYYGKIEYQPDSANTVLYKFNAFVFPRLDEVINADGCWPEVWVPGGPWGFLVNPVVGIAQQLTAGDHISSGNLLETEGAFTAFYLAGGGVTGIANLVGTITSFSASIPYVPTTCTPPQAMQTFFDLVNVYSLMYVEGVMLPILNILISIVAIMGISGLLGGDTNILGLGKLV